MYKKEKSMKWNSAVIGKTLHDCAGFRKETPHRRADSVCPTVQNAASWETERLRDWFLSKSAFEWLLRERHVWRLPFRIWILTLAIVTQFFFWLFWVRYCTCLKITSN
jgi:hypothetical protein